MPITLERLAAGTPRTVAVSYEGETVNITYKPGRITPAVEARLNQAALDNRPAEGLAAELASIITTWDITDEKGKPEPVTEGLLRDLPTRFLVACVQAVGDDIRPNAQSAAT